MLFSEIFGIVPFTTTLDEYYDRINQVLSTELKLPPNILVINFCFLTLELPNYMDHLHHLQKKKTKIFINYLASAARFLTCV